jgi:nitrogenase molybdenum-iron protein alpha/beta subunit
VSGLFPELEGGGDDSSSGPREQAPAEILVSAPVPRDAAPRFDGARAVDAKALYMKLFGLPGRFGAGCRVAGIEVLDPDDDGGVAPKPPLKAVRLCVEVVGGGVPLTRLYFVAGRVEPHYIATKRMSIRVGGQVESPLVDRLIRQIAFRLQDAPLQWLLGIALADPSVHRPSTASEDETTMPDMSSSPTDLDEEYLNSIGFGYSPPGAWRNFLQGHENQYGGIENSRGYCQRLSGSVVQVNHTEIECFYSSPPSRNGSVAFWNHVAPDFDSLLEESRDNLELFSDLEDLDVIKGGTTKLDRLLGTLADSGQSPDVVVLTSTCTTTVIGDDTQGCVEKLKRKVPLRVINMASSRDINTTLFEEAKRSPTFLSVPKIPRSINIVGLPKLVGGAGILSTLKASGVTLNAWVLPVFNIHEVARFMQAEVSVLYDFPFLQRPYNDLLGDLPLKTVVAPSPFGVEGTKRWFAAVAEALEAPRVFDDVLQRQLERITPAWERLGREARGYRLGFIGEERMLRRFFDTRQLLGVPVLPLLEEMGFGIDLYLCRSKGPPPAERQLEEGTRRTRYFDTPAELEDILSSSDTTAFYSELFFDRRITRSSKNTFSIREFGRVGLDGALEGLSRMVGACRLPFYRSFGKYLGRPFAVGHAKGAKEAGDAR